MLTRAQLEKDITLVIFTCEGRAHLLQKTYDSFINASAYQFSKIILAIDGEIDQDIIRQINPTLIVQSTKRVGYVKSIINALANIQTPYFFWLEDDFIFLQELPLDKIYQTLAKMENWAGIFLSRSAPLSHEEKQIHHFEDFYVPNFQYSVSPALCRTQFFKQAFAEMVSRSKDEISKTYGFENFLVDYFIENQIGYALLDPGKIAHVNHFGQLESTAREYHMINSLDEKESSIGHEYISGFGAHRKITLINKLALLPKLFLAFAYLSIKLFSDRESYDFAFRIYLSYLKRFKN